MSEIDRRGFLRVALPAVAMPMVAAQDIMRPDQVTKEEIVAALRTVDNMELSAATLNMRFNLLVDIMFEADPAALRKQLEALHDEKRNANYLIDPDTGRTGSREEYDAAIGGWTEKTA